jgi:ribosomal protein S8
MNKFRALNSLFNTIKIGYLNEHKYTYHKYSKFIKNVVVVLLRHNLIVGYTIDKTSFSIRIQLRYYNSKPIILSHVIYKPSLKWVDSFKDIEPYYNKFDIFVVSTSEGLLSSKDH